MNASVCRYAFRRWSFHPWIRLGVDFLLPDCEHLCTSIRPGHILEVRYVILLLDGDCKLLGVKLEVLVGKREASLQAIDSLVESEPRPFVDAKPGQYVMLGSILLFGRARRIGVEKVHSKKWRPGRGLAPTCQRHSQALQR
jgi:hypothetical protein